MFDAFLRQILLCLEPIGFVWLCLLLCAVFFFHRKQRGPAAMVLGLAVLIFLVGSTRLPGSLLGSLERPYAGVRLEELPLSDAVVMLGGGTEPSRYEAGRLHLTPAGDRIQMALEMMSLRKAPVLVLGGAGAEFDGKFLAESEATARWFQQWKKTGAMDPGVEIIPLSPCVNTHDEAVSVRTLATARGWRGILLVTSANHMRRAVDLFRSQGLDVVPVPCNFLTDVSTAASQPGLGVPTWQGFEIISAWLHEEAGWLEYRRRGWIK
jgi:uncharacterized SAM-binding protein YcdF (DUF218 family)